MQKKANAEPILAAQSGVLPANPEITVAESAVLHHAREWRQAETDAALYAGDGMRLYVNEYRAGRFDMNEAKVTIGGEKKK